MAEITTIPNSNALTAKPLLELSEIEDWRLCDPLPEAWTVSRLENTGTQLQCGLLPCQPEELMVAIGQLTDFGRTFNLPIPNLSGLIERYQQDLAHLPGDILAKAAKQIMASWKWGNRMPMPADILALAHPYLMQRKMAAGRVRIALGKLTTRTSSISPISSTAAKSQCERMTARAVKHLDADETDDMTEAQAYEQLVKDRAKFFAENPELSPNA